MFAGYDLLQRAKEVAVDANHGLEQRQYASLVQIGDSCNRAMDEVSSDCTKRKKSATDALVRLRGG